MFRASSGTNRLGDRLLNRFQHSVFKDISNIAWRYFFTIQFKGKQEGSIDIRLSTGWIVSVIDSLVYAGWWALHSGEMSAQEAGEHAASVLFNGISAH